MAHRGRKRRAKRREPSGKALRPTRQEVREAATGVVTRQPHRRGLKHPTDQRAADVLGRLYLIGNLTEAQYEAGAAWQRARAAMLRALDCPRPHPKSGGFDYVHDRIDGYSAPDQHDLRPEEEKAAAAVDRFNGMLAAISEPRLMLAKMQVWRVCDDDQPPSGIDQLDDLRRGLDALARHLKMLREGIARACEAA